MTDEVTLRPASTVVLLRDTANGVETLLLRRNKALVFAGGLWVFPGGAIDPEDVAAASGDDHLAARLAAVREAKEEAGLELEQQHMVPLSHWITPVAEPKRFATSFFLAAAPAQQEVVIDDSEIHDARWVPIQQAVEEHQRGEIGMLPPTYLSLCALAGFSSVQQTLDTIARRDVPTVFPVMAMEDDQALVMFAGDAGYLSEQADQAGPRHRAVFDGRCWEYHYQGVAADHPSLIDLG